MFQNDTVEFFDKKKNERNFLNIYPLVSCPTDFCIIDIGVYHEGKSEIV